MGRACGAMGQLRGRAFGAAIVSQVPPHSLRSIEPTSRAQTKICSECYVYCIPRPLARRRRKNFLTPKCAQNAIYSAFS